MKRTVLVIVAVAAIALLGSQPVHARDGWPVRQVAGAARLAVEAVAAVAGGVPAAVAFGALLAGGDLSIRWLDGDGCSEESGDPPPPPPPPPPPWEIKKTSWGYIKVNLGNG